MITALTGLADLSKNDYLQKQKILLTYIESLKLDSISKYKIYVTYGKL